MNKKYELTDETIVYYGHTLHRIKLLVAIGAMEAGTLGGYIESEDNLSQEGECMVCGSAKVYGYAEVYGSAEVYDNAKVYGYAKVYDNAKVCGYAEVCDNAKVCGYDEVCGDAEIRANARIAKKEDYITFKNFWSSGRYFTWTRSNNKWKVGCFYGTGNELIDKAYKDSKRSGREYERVVRYVESILADEAKDKTE